MTRIIRITLRQSLRRRLAPLRVLCGGALATATLLGLPVGAQAATLTFGSPLDIAASKDTANNLGYAGTNAVTYGTGVVVHNNHDGADTALWNTTLPGSASPSAPQGGQITSIRLEGCAIQAPGGPPPLTQIHFQALTPIAGGGAHVNVTSQPFDIPTCGVAGAGPRTVTSYAPANFCVSAGDIVDFNDEGGFDPQYYPSGVRFRVIGAVPGATMDSFIANNGTNNGATLAADQVAATSGFARNPHEELLLQSTLATGVDATPLCPGGLHGLPGMPGGKPALAFGQETVGANHAGEIPIAVYCALLGRPCVGTITLQSGATTLGSVALSAPADVVTIVRMQISGALMATLRAQGSIPVVATAHLDGAAAVSHAMRLKL